MATIQDNASGGANARVTAGRLWTGLYDSSGNPITKAVAANAAATDNGMPLSLLRAQNYQLGRGDSYGGLALAQCQPIIIEGFGTITTPNPQRWNYVASGMAASGAIAVGMNLTSTAVTSANAYSGMVSRRWFVKRLRVPLVIKARAMFNSLANSACEIGFGNPVANAANSNGGYWTRDITGSVYPVINYNGGTPIVGAAVAGLVANQYYNWEVIWDDDQYTFSVLDCSTGYVISQQVLRMPLTQPKFYANDHGYVYMRVYNSGTAPASAPLMTVSEMMVGQLDNNTSYTAAELASFNNWGGEVTPVLGANTQNWANSTAASNATLSNTAAGYGALGGKFAYAAIAGSNVDYCLFGYSVPYNFHVKGVYIDTFVSGAASTGVAVLQWAIGQATAVSLATANGLRRLIGVQNFIQTASIGAQANSLNREWATPFVVPSGNFLQIILTIPVGTATPSEVFTGIVDVDGWFE